MGNSNTYIAKADYEISYSWFFKHNKNKFGYTDIRKDDGSIIGVCGYIALSMLFQYNEFFVSSGYFTKYEMDNYIRMHNVFNIDQKEEAIPTVSPNFVKNFYNSYSYDGVHEAPMRNIFWKWLKNKPSKYNNVDLWLKSGFFKTPWNNIEYHNKPTLLGGTYNLGGRKNIQHVTIAYGVYNNGDFLAHAGWNNNTQIRFSHNLFSLVLV